VSEQNLAGFAAEGDLAVERSGTMGLMARLEGWHTKHASWR